ncbi:MAG: N-acetylmuramoyl-L-alanine amidase [Alphaproteobacteria bacterium]|jgi:N-acetylmuramoyl-L-alanine amidase|nr:N-acetylmuramoyl-L-alanine amidase [Alphaproteobacteria bacterium]MDP6564891.1 N-acetylmuramoyl-L-alanine amidase [Alphaproteobacteria bacterium]
MRVRGHLLQSDAGEAVPFERSPNQSAGLSPKYLIIHYTAGSSAESSIGHMLKPSAKASAHLVVARDGVISQLVPFNRVAWHAGRSQWHGTVGLNRHAIGIELDNAGKLEWQGNQWRSWFGRSYPEDEILVAAHKHEDRDCGWHVYTEAQLMAVTEAAQAIMDHYSLLDVLGHDDIAPNRKRDPGPAFPMDSFRASITGRDADLPLRFEVRVNLNIRGGPGTAHDKIRDEPLPPGTLVLLHSRESSWCFVEVLDENGAPDLTGWVHGDYIAPADAEA